MTNRGKWKRTPESIQRWRDSREKNGWKQEDYISSTHRPYFTPYEESWGKVQRTTYHHSFMRKGPQMKQFIPILEIMAFTNKKKMPQLTEVII